MSHTDRQTDRQGHADRYTHAFTDKKARTNKQTDGQIHTHTDRQIDR